VFAVSFSLFLSHFGSGPDSDIMWSLISLNPGSNCLLIIYANNPVKKYAKNQIICRSQAAKALSAIDLA
jgi:hypothetical protein